MHIYFYEFQVTQKRLTIFVEMLIIFGWNCPKPPRIRRVLFHLQGFAFEWKPSIFNGAPRVNSGTDVRCQGVDFGS